MTPSPNHILKFQRGRRHLNDLRSLTERWFNGNHHSARFEVNPTDAGELLIRASVDPIPTDPFSLVISDVIQNFRGCLEHLAYALTAAFTSPLPEDVARDSQFPIIGDVDRKGNRPRRNSISEPVEMRSWHAPCRTIGYRGVAAVPQRECLPKRTSMETRSLVEHRQTQNPSPGRVVLQALYNQ